MISAIEVASEKHPCRKGGEIRWHGSQRGQIVMDERKLSVKRPRLRRRDSGEVPVPAHEQLNENLRLAERVHDIMVTGHRDPDSISAYVRIATETLRDVSLPVPT